MSALARDGQAGAARAAYRQFVERLSTDLGLTPGAELRALHDALTGARPLARRHRRGRGQPGRRRLRRPRRRS